MKSICFVITKLSAYGGTERACVNLVNQLCHKYNITILSLKCCIEPAYKLDDRIKVASVLTHGEKIRNVYNPCNLYKIYKFYRANNFKKIIIVGTYGVVSALIPAGFVSCKVIVWQHTSIANRLNTNVISRMLYIYATMVADYLVLLTEKDRRNAIQKKSVRGKVKAVYNMIVGKVTASYNNTSKKIITVGRIDYVKGLDLLLKVAQTVLPKYPEWSWHIYGDVEDESLLVDFKRNLKKYNLERQLIYEGVSKNIDKCYLESSFCVMTSRNEGLPMSLLEAKMSWLPIVAFDCQTGPSEIIENNKSGYLVPCYDIDMMSEKIINLIGDENTRSEFAKHAGDNLWKFSSDEITKKWIDIIEEI